MRHGEAESTDAWAEDFERPLTRRGVAEVQDMAQRMKARGLIPDLILASPAERAWTTAQIVLGVCELDEAYMRCARELYLAAPDRIWTLIAKQAASCVHILACAHNPGLSELASRLGPKQLPRSLSTAGIASARWNAAAWNELSPQSAFACDLDEPGNPPELMV